MSRGQTEKDGKNRLTVLLPALLIMIVISSSAGCIDKGIVDSIVEKVEGDTGPDFVWEYLLQEEGNFILEPEDGTDPDFQQIASKVAGNITNPDPTQTIDNMKKIMNEENLSMRKYIYKFPVFEGTRILNIELTGIFKISGGSSEASAGYMELTIIDPDGRSDREDITQFQERKVYTYAQDPIPGEWKLELQGFGLQSPFDNIYSGEYIISARAEMPKES